MTLPNAHVPDEKSSIRDDSKLSIENADMLDDDDAAQQGVGLHRLLEELDTIHREVNCVTFCLDSDFTFDWGRTTLDFLSRVFSGR